MTGEQHYAMRRLLREAQQELNRATNEITDPASDRLIAVCSLLIQGMTVLVAPPPREAEHSADSTALTNS